jgi:KaiC/GvpD/RAD55 family RecA-like ATPase
VGFRVSIRDGELMVVRGMGEAKGEAEKVGEDRLESLRPSQGLEFSSLQ